MRKSLTVVCLALSLLMLLPVMPQVQAQQNAASNPLGCTLTGLLATATATTKVVSAAPATSRIVFINGAPTTITTTQSIKVCAYKLQVKQTAGAANFGLITGTGSNCATGSANVTTQYFGTASVVDNGQQEFGPGTYLVVPPGKDLCLKLSATPTDSQATIVYAYAN